MLNTDYIKCTNDQYVRYLNDTRLRNIVKDLHGHKRRGKIIYRQSFVILYINMDQCLSFYFLR